MYGCSSSIILANCDRSSDWAPSLMAFSGAGCVSTIRPSAPTATPARATGGTRLRFPVAWLGSRITGRCVSSLRTGIAEMSQVLHVGVSVGGNVLGAHQQLLDAAAQTALEQHRLPAFAQRFQQHEVLHVARAD